MFLLKTEDLTLKLEIVPVSTLIPHEAIISNVSQRLTMEFANFANLQHPVIIEKNNIILDGNHRVSVFKKLGFKHIAVCRINYFNRCVKLRYWFRLLGNMNDLAILKSIIQKMGGRFDPVPTQEALVEAWPKTILAGGFNREIASSGSVIQKRGSLMRLIHTVPWKNCRMKGLALIIVFVLSIMW